MSGFKGKAYVSKGTNGASNKSNTLKPIKIRALSKYKIKTIMINIIIIMFLLISVYIYYVITNQLINY